VNKIKVRLHQFLNKRI